MDAATKKKLQKRLCVLAAAYCTPTIWTKFMRNFVLSLLINFRFNLARYCRRWLIFVGYLSILSSHLNHLIQSSLGSLWLNWIIYNEIAILTNKHTAFYCRDKFLAFIYYLLTWCISYSKKFVPKNSIDTSLCFTFCVFFIPFNLCFKCANQLIFFTEWKRTFCFQTIQLDLIFFIAKTYSTETAHGGK